MDAAVAKIVESLKQLPVEEALLRITEERNRAKTFIDRAVAWDDDEGLEDARVSLAIWTEAAEAFARYFQGAVQ